VRCLLHQTAQKGVRKLSASLCTTAYATIHQVRKSDYLIPRLVNGRILLNQQQRSRRLHVCELRAQANLFRELAVGKRETIGLRLHGGEVCARLLQVLLRALQVCASSE
jgi:hypothetical protein